MPELTWSKWQLWLREDQWSQRLSSVSIETAYQDTFHKRADVLKTQAVILRIAKEKGDMKIRNTKIKILKAGSRLYSCFFIFAWILSRHVDCLFPDSAFTQGKIYLKLRTGPLAFAFPFISTRNLILQWVSTFSHFAFHLLGMSKKRSDERKKWHREWGQSRKAANSLTGLHLWLYFIHICLTETKLYSHNFPLE